MLVQPTTYTKLFIMNNIMYNHYIKYQLFFLCDDVHVTKWMTKIKQTLPQYASKFTLCFTKFWMKLDKLTMVKVGNPIINNDELLRKCEFINS
jgi:hypothetical protein